MRYVAFAGISIHALREEGDATAAIHGRGPAGDFYPRPPRGGRPTVAASGDLLAIFLSTPSARRATYPLHHCIMHSLFLSTPSARRATAPEHRRRTERGISIHALREEGDRQKPNGTKWFFYFYPRPPRGGRRGRSGWPQRPSCISIHALREEGDDIAENLASGVVQFLSTPSARRATYLALAGVLPHTISIHALREEGDIVHRAIGALQHDFYPRPPRGGRPHRHLINRTVWGISIHALREEGDSSIMLHLPVPS